MEFQIDFTAADGLDQCWVGDAPNVEVAEDIVLAANPGSVITWIASEADDDIDDDSYDDSMDGDFDSAMTSAGWGTDEDYGDYGDDYF